MEASLRLASRDWELGRQAANDVLMEFTAISEHYGKQLELQLDLTGGYQKKNIKTVLSAVSELQQQGIPIGEKQLTEALRQEKAITGFAGRWQTLNQTQIGRESWRERSGRTGKN